MPAITETMMYASLARHIARSQVEVQRAQEQAASGRRVTTADQDPVAASQSTLYAGSLAALAGMHAAGDAAQASMARVDQALQSVQRILIDAEAAAILGVNQNAAPDQAMPAAVELKQLHATLLGLANAKDEQGYIFSGFSGAQPFTADGTYAGFGSAAQVEVAPGVEVPMGWPGDQIFNAPAGFNLLGSLQDLAQALGDGQPDRARAALDGLQGGIAQVAQMSAQVSAAMQANQLAYEVRQDLEAGLRQDNSRAVEADEVLSLTELMRSESAYQAAIAEASHILQGLDGGLLRS